MVGVRNDERKVEDVTWLSPEEMVMPPTKGGRKWHLAHSSPRLWENHLTICASEMRMIITKPLRVALLCGLNKITDVKHSEQCLELNVH